MNNPVPSRPYAPPDDPRLPRFSSYEEEAEFWDTHDAFDLSPIPPEELAEHRAIIDAETEETRGRDGLTEQLTVRLDRETYDGIVAEAREIGVGPTTLARVWLRERLRSRR